MHRLIWDVPSLLGKSMQLQWGKEWNNCSQEGQFWASEVEQTPTRPKVDIVLFTHSWAVLLINMISCQLMLLYENKFDEQDTQCTCYLFHHLFKIWEQSHILWGEKLRSTAWSTRCRERFLAHVTLTSEQDTFLTSMHLAVIGSAQSLLISIEPHMYPVIPIY